MVWKWILWDDESRQWLCKPPPPPPPFLCPCSSTASDTGQPLRLRCILFFPASFDALLHRFCSILNWLVQPLQVTLTDWTFSAQLSTHLLGSPKELRKCISNKAFSKQAFSCFLYFTHQYSKSLCTRCVLVYSCVTHSQPGCLWLSFLVVWSRILIFLWTTQHRAPCGQDPWLKMVILYSSGHQQSQLEIPWHTPRNTQAMSSPAHYQPLPLRGWVTLLGVSALPPWHCWDRTGKAALPGLQLELELCCSRAPVSFIMSKK